MPDVLSAASWGIEDTLSTRELSDAPELREPLPLTPEQMVEYQQFLAQQPLSYIGTELELVDRTFAMLQPALPEWRLQFDQYPHPLVQKRLILLNEIYRRSNATPIVTARYFKGRNMLEWSLAGAVVGGLIGGVTKGEVLLGTAAGAILGAVTGRSVILQDVLTSLSRSAVVF